MEVDLTTIAGIAGIAWVLTEFVGHYVEPLRKYKKLLALGICIALGVASRLSGIGFAGIPWLTFVVNLAFAIISAQLVNDKLMKPIGLHFSDAKSARKR